VPLLGCALVGLVALVACHRNAPQETDSPSSLTPTPPLATPTPPADPVAAAALARGQSIAAQAFALLSSNLSQAIGQSGLTNALAFCSDQALPLTDLVAATNQARIRRVTHKPRNPRSLATPAERLILDAYRVELARGNTALAPVVVSPDPITVTVYAPIVIANPLCLDCHGTPGAELRPEVLAFIRRLYPQDAATGFRLGELRGAWRIDLAVGEIRTHPQPSPRE